MPLYYDARGDKLGVSVGDLNERIATKLEELETEDMRGLVGGPEMRPYSGAHSVVAQP